MEFTLPKKSYFAAANGFTGFRSYFEAVFNPKDFLRLYVIKGGPGTGKSTLMKRISNHFSDQYAVEAIFCSSDKNSLDGIIVNTKKGKIALLDGTAPHETDAKIPGAIDKIVNLGNAWNENLLVKKREEIVNINSRKKSHYRTAYEYLGLAGMFFDKTFKYIKTAYQKNDTQIINDILFDIPHLECGSNYNTRLISSFGKDGYSRLDSIKSIAKKKVSIGGTYGSEFIFMKRLAAALESRGAPHIRFLSPFCDSLIEGVLIPDSDMLIIVGNEFAEKIDTSVFLEYDLIEESEEVIEYYLKKFDELLERSRKEFSSASTQHFELEKIYSDAMNFREIDLVRNKIIEEITELAK